MDHEAFADAGLAEQRIERDEETAAVVVVVEPERIENWPQAIDDEVADVGRAQQGDPGGAHAIVEQVESVEELKAKVPLK